MTRNEKARRVLGTIVFYLMLSGSGFIIWAVHFHGLVLSGKSGITDCGEDK